MFYARTVARTSRQKGRLLSGAVSFEMAAEPTGLAIAAGGGFCAAMWRLAFAFSLLTMVTNGGVDEMACQLFQNSISRECTPYRQLDGCSQHHMACGLNGIAELALHNSCMLPWSMKRRQTERRGAHHLDEPNTMLHVPKPYECLACDCNSDFMNLPRGEVAQFQFA